MKKNVINLAANFSGQWIRDGAMHNNYPMGAAARQSVGRAAILKIAGGNKEKKSFILFYFYHLLLRILAVIGRYGPHLMIVIFVTQNNF